MLSLLNTSIHFAVRSILLWELVTKYLDIEKIEVL